MNAIAPISVLLMSVALLLTGQGLQSVLLPVRAQAEALSTLAIGTMGSAYFLGFAVGCLTCPRLVQSVGHIRSFAAMTAVASAAPLIHAMWISPFGWILTRAITGVSIAALTVIIESWLNDRSTNETRGTVLSAYMVINLTVITVGQMMLTLAEPTEFLLFAVASVLVSVAAVPVALTRQSQPAPLESVAIRPFRILTVSPVAFVGCAVVGLANGAWWALAPLFTAQDAPDTTRTAVFMSACVIGGAVGQWPLGRLSDRMDRRRVVLGASLLAVLASLCVLATSGQGPLLYVSSALWGAAAFPLYSLAVAHANDRAAREDLVETSSSLLLIYGAGAVIGPIVASTVMQIAGPDSLYLHTAAMHIGLAAFALWSMGREAEAPDHEPAPFAEALRAAETISPAFDAARLAEATAADGGAPTNDASPGETGAPVV